jgi:hypothetical protein
MKEEQDKIWSRVPKGGPIPRTNWSTDCRPQEELQLQHRLDLSSERADPSVTALARPSSYSKLQTRPLVREGATTYEQ